jgi:hypothetical protein
VVRKALSRKAAVLAAALFAGVAAGAQPEEPAGAAAVVRAIVWGLPMAPADRTADLPTDVQQRLAEYRKRDQTFRTALKAAPNESLEERSLFEKRVRIERVIFCLFPRRDSARMAAAYASDAEIAYEWEGLSEPPRREAAFVDALLRDLPQPWLAPYLHLIAGHRKLCASQLEGPETPGQRDAMAADARRQLARARDGGHPLIRVAADYVLIAGRCLE